MMKVKIAGAGISVLQYHHQLADNFQDWDYKNNNCPMEEIQIQEVTEFHKMMIAIIQCLI